MLFSMFQISRPQNLSFPVFSHSSRPLRLSAETPTAGSSSSKISTNDFRLAHDEVRPTRALISCRFSR